MLEIFCLSYQIHSPLFPTLGSLPVGTVPISFSLLWLFAGPGQFPAGDWRMDRKWGWNIKSFSFLPGYQGFAAEVTAPIRWPCPWSYPRQVRVTAFSSCSSGPWVVRAPWCCLPRAPVGLPKFHSHLGK